LRRDAVEIGIIGLGTVGTGTVRVLLGNRQLLYERTGFDIHLKRIADLDITKGRGIELPEGILTTDPEDILNDPEIDIVVELIGGVHPAKDLILGAVRSGKHVVTANKALLAVDGNELFEEAAMHGVGIGFEASVAGGIPIIKIMREGLVANRILNIYGIINGTSNYILSRMTNEGIEFNHALREAQRLGYAEADPTFDIEGIDSAHKLSILASLAYNIPLSYGKVYREGISEITPQDIGFASELGFKIKLLAIAKAGDGTVELRVHPTMIPRDYLISKVEGIFNAIYVEGDAVGATLYYGKGAGDMPTGSAIVSDIVDIARIMSEGAKGRIPAKRIYRIRSSALRIMGIEEVECMYYFRFSAMDNPGVLSRIAGVFGDNNISIASVIQKGRREGGAVPLVLLTHMAKERDVREAVRLIDAMPIVSEKTRFIRVEGREE
jgi:homoserine dehydrogenase